MSIADQAAQAPPYGGPGFDADMDRPLGWGVTAAAMLCLMLGPSALLVSSFSVFQAPLAAAFGWSRGEIGIAVSLMALSIVVASPLQGVLIDRFGVRRVILASIPCLAAGLAALSLMASDLVVFYVAWAAMPFLAVGVWPAAYLKSVSGWFDRRLGLATGVANAGIGLGTIVLPPLLAAVIASFGVRAGLLAMGLLALAAFPIAFTFVKERPANPAYSDLGARLSYGAALKAGPYRYLIVGFFLLGVTGTGLLANLVPIIKDAGASPLQAVAAMSAFGFAALAGRLFTGWLLDRLHAAVVINILAATTLLALLTLAFGRSAPAAVAAATMLGLLSGGEFDVLAYAIRRYFGLASFGKMYGAAFSVFQMGAAGGAAVLAASVARTQSYTAGLLFLAVSIILSCLTLARLPAYPAAAMQIR